MVYSTKLFFNVLPCVVLFLCFFGPFGVAIASLGEGVGRGAGLGAFRAFVRFALVWFCLFLLPLGVWEGLRFVIVALPALFSYLCLLCHASIYYIYVVRNVKCFVFGL